MTFFTDLQAALDTLRGMLGDDAEATQIPTAVQRLTDDGVISLIECATALVRGGESLRIAGSGVVASRSRRESGHSGLAQKRGHRSSVSLIQNLTGTTRADAAKQVRLGETLTPVGDAPDAADGADLEGAHSAPTSRAWHAPLGDALMKRALTSAQHDAIFRGLGEPPTASGDAPAGACDAVVAAWTAAATQLIDEAACRTVEELASAARTVRDLLDPAGAERRFDERFEGRSFRMWTDRDGTRRGSFAFDDEAAAWVETIIATALRPRRGGPRFIDPEEQARAEELISDSRTNDQLTYDLIIDVLRAGALSDAKSVFGTRQAGVRLVMTTDAAALVHAGVPAVGLVEDDGTSLPAWLVAQHACDTGTTTCTLDSNGNPLDLGREQRLFTPKQRVTLAIRDGGCRWRGCDRPASYCEAHHIDEWHRDKGRTDVDRGILLCRFHHMQLHHGGWRITREGNGDFLLHPPDGGPPVALPTRLARRYAWGDLRPPPRRLLPAA